MKKETKVLVAEKIKDFHLPRYHELPDIGLYLEQVTKYINGFLSPLGCLEITPSMVSNYVKKGVIASPVKKQYYAEQIAYLMFMSIAKGVLSIDNISKLINLQKQAYDAATAYNYFCSEFENVLQYTCGLKENLDNIGTTDTEEKMIFRSVIISACHLIFVNNCFDVM